MTAIVFCEDDPTIQKLIRVALRDRPYAVHFATDGAEGLELVERVRPAVIFSDITMPGVDGFEMLRRLRARPDLASIPVVFLTASAQPLEIARGTALGVDGYLVKPFDTSTLRAEVDKYLMLPHPQPSE